MQEAKKGGKVGLVEDLLLRIELPNLGMVLVQRGAGDLPDTDGLEAVEASHRIVALNSLCLCRSLG